jgi:membrane protein DedA with SNARE-associated domain
MSFDVLLALFVQYGYAIVFAAILLDNAGLPIPGELLLLLFGAVARTGDLDLGLGLLVAWAAALSGDTIGYWLGRLTGDGVLRIYCRMTLGSGRCIHKALGYYERYGKATVVAGRFVMGVRAFLAPLAGSVGMPFRHFLLFDGLGALIWSALFLALGYSLGWRPESLHDGYRAGSVVLLGVVSASVGTYVLVKLVRRRRHGPPSFPGRSVARLADALRWPRPHGCATGLPAGTAHDTPGHQLALPPLATHGSAPTTIETQGAPPRAPSESLTRASARVTTLPSSRSHPPNADRP